MQRIFLTLIFIFSIIATALPQYNSEQVLEKKFQTSDLYFQRFYLNTYGLRNFSKVSAGLMDDPFVKLELNPANGLLDSLKKVQFYFDYRNTRENYFPNSFVRPFMGQDRAFFIPPDPRWYRETRREPEPVFSVGIRFKPTSHLSLTTAYQLIYKEEPFYREPVYIYYSRYGYDPFGRMVVNLGQNVPSVTRNQQEDQLLTRAHLFAGYLSYQLKSNLDIGFGADFVTHHRNGNAINNNRGEYGEHWLDLNEMTKKEHYDHHDLFAGFNWLVNQKLKVGLQAGLLQGDVRQTEATNDSTKYQNSHSLNHTRNITNLLFKHDGKKYYSTISLNYKLGTQKSVSFFLNYSKLNTDIHDDGNINDRGYYHYRSESGLQYWDATSTSYLTDRRTNSGNLNEHLWEAMFTLKLHGSSNTRVHLGFYYSYLSGQKYVTEPVLYDAYSYYRDESDDTINGYRLNQNTTRRYEDKTLNWDYNYTRQSIQMPIYWWHKVQKNIAFFIVLNKLWTAWKTDETTQAYFRKRVKIHNGQQKITTNFIEKYLTNPVKYYTEDTADFAIGFEVHIIKNTLIRYMVNPDFSPELRISQWWLGLSTTFD